MLERIAIALGIDTMDLFSTKTNLPEKMKAYRKAALRDIKGLLGRIIDEQLQGLDKDP